MQTNKLYINRVSVLLLLSCLLTGGAKTLFAQKKDTLATMRDFVHICNAYKQMPLYLELEMKNSTNFITRQEDTVAMKGEFYLKNENSYVRFGDFEQVVNDTLALLISNRQQHMILYADAAPVVKRMKSMMGGVLPDSSVQNLARKYRSASQEMSGDASVIKLQSRAMIYGTNLPKETIELQYHVSEKTPERVATLTRSLVRLDSTQYSQLRNESALKENLLVLEGSYFLIKEQVITYQYKQIDQAVALKVPVLMSDRIMINETGDYMPVKEYESYRLTKNE
jgi:hypothetical protein